ncbi:hypothetical protein B0H12DRAFT_1153518 [Mycena haematopus]|nr:hypothetical protein B0H12DRAFT_1153518 [Mycena haematopus]
MTPDKLDNELRGWQETLFILFLLLPTTGIFFFSKRLCFELCELPKKSAEVHEQRKFVISRAHDGRKSGGRKNQGNCYIRALPEPPISEPPPEAEVSSGTSRN